MTNAEAIKILQKLYEGCNKHKNTDLIKEAYNLAIEALKAQMVKSDDLKAESAQNVQNGDLISRKLAIDALYKMLHDCFGADEEELDAVITTLNDLPSAQPDLGKYEYHYDHTDCIWYRPEAMNRCPTTCAQYRDGWNDAMNYIFRDGKGYMPYRRDKQYGE